MLNAQLKGHRYPEGTDAAVEVEVRSASLAAAGDRLLIALKVKAHEKKSWFGFGANANVNIWGKPVLDPKTQILRLTEVSLDINSGAAYGLLNTAARAALPYLQQAVADNAVHRPDAVSRRCQNQDRRRAGRFPPGPRRRRRRRRGRDLRLTGIAFDSNTLRVIAQAEGTAKVAVTSLPRL